MILKAIWMINYLSLSFLLTIIIILASIWFLIKLFIGEDTDDKTSFS